MTKFRKKPVVIEAWQFQVGCDAPHWLNQMTGWKFVAEAKGLRPTSIEIDTLEGVMTASPDDWIIRGVKGELYPCKPDIFEATYDAVED